MSNLVFAQTIESHFRYFLKELRMTGKSEYTIISYNTTITSFVRFLKQYEREINFSTIKKLDLMNFLDYKNAMLQKQTELKASSKNLYIIHLKTFFTYILENMDENGIKISTIFNLKIKVPESSPKGIADEDIYKIIAYLNALDKNYFLNVRISLLVKMYLYTGARRDELRNVKISDFHEMPDRESYVVNTIGKGQKERTLYILKELVKEELLCYKKYNIERIALSARTHKLMNGSQIYKFLNTHYRKAGVNETGVHILRHTFAKTQHANGTNIVQLQKMLSHAKLQSTMIYTNPTQDDVYRAQIASMHKIIKKKDIDEYSKAI